MAKVVGMYFFSITSVKYEQETKLYKSNFPDFQFFILLFILMLVELAMACVFLVYSREVGEFICVLCNHFRRLL